MRLYRRAISIYPKSFQSDYGEQSFLCARDWYRDAANQRQLLRFWRELGRDLLASLSREHWINIRGQIVRQPIVFYTIGLILIFTLLGGAAAMTAQQMLRRGANEPQQQMARLYSLKMAAGEDPEKLIPAVHIDLAESLEPFLTFYDEAGRPLRSSGYLDSVPAVPPPGVFAYARAHGSDTLTWQPRPGVRIAMVAMRVKGPRPGFLLAGRSLRVVEQYEDQLYRMAFLGWVLVIALLAGGASLLTRTTARLQPTN